jgi:dihydroneopterin aldolase
VSTAWDDLDRITVAGITARGHHGVLAFERRDGQTFVVDVALGVDTRAAAARDDLALTVDYSAVAADVVALIGGEPADLIETLAQRIADACLAYQLVQVVQVTVHKPEAPVGVPFGDVVLAIERAR